MAVTKTAGYSGTIADDDVTRIIVKRATGGGWACSVKLVVDGVEENQAYTLDGTKETAMDSWLSDIKTALATALSL
jgi:hypothetical protein